MGCDIHMFCEVRNKETGKWEYQSKKFPNKYWDKNKPNKIDEDGYEWNPEFTDYPFSGRSYDTFSILAGVRNGYGFAGVSTGEGFKPISRPKGVPNDASGEYLKKVEDWHGDGHSHSYFTLEEIKRYDWDQTTKKRGIVSVEEYKRIEGKGCPESWCGGVSGADISIAVSPADKKLILMGGSPIGIKGIPHNYVEHFWEDTYRSRATYFLETTLPLLEALGKDEDVRIVFFFDN